MIENTSQRDPFVHVLGGLSDGLDGYIRGMEAGGQRQVVHSSVLPTDGPWDDLIALGFTRGEPVPGDPLFTNCTLPEGWAKAGTDHDMWSNVMDERGVERVMVFYKAAFYDRRADMYIARAGYRASTEALYGDDAPALPPKWDVFTDEERADFWASVEDMQAKIEDPLYGHIYAERAPRVAALLALR